MDQQTAYRQYSQQTSLPIFAQPWWLDITAGKNQWSAVIANDNQGNVLGSWAFGIKKILGQQRIFLPPFTPYLGPQLNYPAGLNTYEQRSFEHKALQSLIQLLPASRDIRFKWSVGYDNWLPFHWNGFQQTTRYTYVLKDTSNLAFLYSQFKDSLQRQIRKAEKTLQIRSNTTPDLAIQWLQKGLDKRFFGGKIQAEVLQALNQSVTAHGCGTILEAFDQQGIVHAAISIVWDSNSMYYLYGGFDENFRDSGATALLFRHAIQLAAEKNIAFNFEGSMISGVERFFRSFGAELTPVHFIYKSSFPFNLIGI